MPEAVTGMLLVKDLGAVGTKAVIIVTSFEQVVLNPKAFLDQTLNLQVVLAVRAAVVEQDKVVMPDYKTTQLDMPWSQLN